MTIVTLLRTLKNLEILSGLPVTLTDLQVVEHPPGHPENPPTYTYSVMVGITLADGIVFSVGTADATDLEDIIYRLLQTTGIFNRGFAALEDAMCIVIPTDLSYLTEKEEPTWGQN